ncbi:MAG: serine/threonine-protein kinase [Dokdonella sp.]
MSDARRALQLFEQVIAVDPAERAVLLDRECAGDAALHANVEALLQADAAAGDFLSHPLSGRSDRSGERLGSYRLMHLIGNGGMGSVYQAERADGAFAKPIAIKLLLFDAGDLRTRFALEQRILGALSHPHIASLLDVGQDANGAPYLVMEYVEGHAITTYVHEHGLDVRARLRLFLKILDAVQSAHNHLVVHRDIKPGNVLVDEHGNPKLLDFGIAKLLGDSQPSATGTGMGPLTPEYASPEQVRGEPIGTASDVYSLGVLLFELVTGERPYRIDTTRASAIERTICDTEPTRPSTHLRSRRIGGSARDLDAIVLKALAKQPVRRYASCAVFADDLRRWLESKEVLARQPPWSERAARILRRHRLIAAVTITAAITLLVGSAAALWQAHIAGVQRDRAERINHFLVGMLAAADPGDLGRKATVADVLDRAQRQATRELADDPAIAASTELTLAKTYAALGDLDAARHCAQLALESAQHADDGSTLIDARIALGEILKLLGQYDAAATMLDSARAEALDHGTQSQRGHSALGLGSLESMRGDYTHARQWFDTALVELPANADAERAEVLNDLAIVESSLGDDASALKLHEKAVGALRKLYPHGHPLLAEALGNLANSQQANGLNAPAKANFAAALAMQIDLLGENHQNVVQTLSSMTYVDLANNDTAAALSDGARAWSGAQQLSDGNQIRAYAAIMYGQALVQAGHDREGVTLIEAALNMRKAHYPAGHPLIVNTESVLGLAEAQTGDISAGETLARSAYERQRAKLGEKHALSVLARQRLVQIETLKKNGQPLPNPIAAKR